MKAKIKDNQLTIDLHELADTLSDEDRKQFARFAVYQDTLLEAVVDTVVTGACFDDDWHTTSLTRRLREKLLPLMPDAMRELVTNLLEENSRLKSANDQYHDALFQLLWKYWPKHIAKEPAIDRYHYGRTEYLTLEQADQWLNSKLPAGEWERIKAEAVAKDGTAVLEEAGK
jgi:hypothetical protein